MKIDKLSIDGKKQSIEVLDKIFSAKVNNQLVSGVVYKLNANFKGEKQRQSKEMKLLVQRLKFTLKKELVMRDTLVKKLLYL